MTWHIVYLSYESSPGGRNYIGKHSTDNLYDGYLGSFKDSSFHPDSRTILGVFNTPEAAVQSEIQWQRVFEVVPNTEFANKSYQTSKKFDTTGVQAPNKGKPRTKEERQAISEGTRKALEEKGFDNKGEKNPMFGRVGEAHPSFGKTRSAESKQKMSVAKKGKSLSKEHKIKLSEAKVGNQNRKGKKDTDETRRKKSEALKGKKRGPYKKKEHQ
jgi:hypothetical protein